MASMEERLTAVERTLRLHNRDRSVMRALFNAALEDVDRRFDDVDRRFNAVDEKLAEMKVEIAALDSRLQNGLAAIEADNRAILEILRKPSPPA
jgi:DNA repair ATPase RecN